MAGGFLMIAGTVRAAAGAAGAARSGGATAAAAAKAEATTIVNVIQGASEAQAARGTSTSEKFFTVLNGLQLIRELDSNLPTFQHVIMVTIEGGPKADLLRIWQLALSTAFGRYRQAGLEGIQGASLEASWDITGKAVMCRLSYVNSGAIEVGQYLAAQTGVQGVSARNTVGNFLTQGPTQLTIGGDRLSWVEADRVVAAAAGGVGMAYIGGKLAGAVVSYILPNLGQLAEVGTTTQLALATIAATKVLSAQEATIRAQNPLPDFGRVITTPDKSDPNIQPPEPAYDGISRVFPYVALVANALTEPCYLPASPPYKPRKKRVPKKFPRSSLENFAVLNRTVQGYAESLPINFDAEDARKNVQDGYPNPPIDVADLTGERNEQ